MKTMCELRMYLNRSQEELGDDVGVSKQWISKIERGEDNAPEWLADAIAGKLGVDTDEIFEIESERRRFKVKKK